MQNATNTSPSFPFIGRLMMAAIFLVSGAGKIAAPAMTIGYIGAMGLPFPTLGFAVAVAVEIGGGLLLAFGFQTRITALMLAVFSVVTGLVFHHAIGDQNQLFNLLKNIAMAGGLLQFMTFGPGAFSLDARKASKITPRTV
ncbi:DoxX family protein [Collimonas humicola]|uniref:DoxX family protein n=1 Tax=Collimonas humicola TaxID=2825886 RepID=UPI001B8B61B5|nr:DoxX family protein [Collimonas humicola]